MLACSEEPALPQRVGDGKRCPETEYARVDSWRRFRVSVAVSSSSPLAGAFQRYAGAKGIVRLMMLGAACCSKRAASRSGMPPQAPLISRRGMCGGPWASAVDPGWDAERLPTSVGSNGALLGPWIVWCRKERGRVQSLVLLHFAAIPPGRGCPAAERRIVAARQLFTRSSDPWKRYLDNPSYFYAPGPAPSRFLVRHPI